jgi:PAS domain S-box-containing protein
MSTSSRRVAEQQRRIAALEAELAERREQYRAMVEHNPRPTWIYSPESLQFLYVNPVAVRSYGWSSRQFLGMTIADIRPREDVPRLLADVAEMRGRASSVSGPWRHRHRDGTVIEVAISAVRMPYSGRDARLIVVESMRVACDLGGGGGLGLSAREHQVLCLVARGHTSQEIALKLLVSPKSVETYRARFMAKLGLRSRADIVKFAIEHGMLDDRT